MSSSSEFLSPLNDVKPPIKWVGGKTQILGNVLARFPKNDAIDNYYEPFLGGGSVLLGVLQLVEMNKLVIKGGIIASDLNPNLIFMYKNIQTHVEELIKELKMLSDVFASQCTPLPKELKKATNPNRSPNTLEDALTSQESFYFWIRKQFNSLKTFEEKSSPKASAMLIFLNKTCFRGVYREGPKGFNVPFGNYSNPSVVDEDNLRKISRLVRQVEFKISSFEDAFENILKTSSFSTSSKTNKSFVYLDPPYAPETDKSFTGYTSEGFSKEKHIKLFEMCKQLLRENRINFLMSNSSVKLVLEKFPSDVFNVETISCRRAIHQKTGIKDK